MQAEWARTGEVVWVVASRESRLWSTVFALAWKTFCLSFCSTCTWRRRFQPPQHTTHTHTHTFIYKYTIYTYFFCCCFLFYSFCCSFLWLNTKAAGFCASACPACSSSKRLTWCRAGSDKDREGEQREREGREQGCWVMGRLFVCRPRLLVA